MSALHCDNVKGVAQMIAVLLAASLVQTVSPAHKPSPTAPCHAVPALCLTSEQERAQPLGGRPGASPDNKMSAYRFDARPCRVIGNFGCPKQARLQLFRLGEPVRETLSRTFLPR